MRRPFAIVLVGFAFLVAAVLLAKVVPPWLASSDGLTSNDRAAEISRARTAFVAILAGTVATIGAVFTGLSYRLNRAGQITERFTRAIEQLANENLEVRLGGIYALERIAHESPADQRPIIYVLAAYVRTRSPWPPDTTRAVVPEAAEDIKAIVAVLRRRNVGNEGPEPVRVGLAHTNIRGTRASGVHLAEADLRGAQLQGTDLSGAHLRGANLQGATLTATNLRNADLDDAILRDARYDAATIWPTPHFDAQGRGAVQAGANAGSAAE